MRNTTKNGATPSASSAAAQCQPNAGRPGKALPTERVLAKAPLGVYWETYGTNPEGEQIKLTVTVVVPAAEGKIAGIVQQERQFAPHFRIESKPVLVRSFPEHVGFDHLVSLVARAGVTAREPLNIPRAEIIRRAAGRVRHEARFRGADGARANQQKDRVDCELHLIHTSPAPS